MVKLFPNLPASLAFSSPEVPPAEWYGEYTFDENELLHSYNDLPMMVDSVLDPKARRSDKHFSATLQVTSTYEFRWYSHGKIFRSENKPPIVKVSANMYSTYNEYRLLHSYDGKPSRVEVTDDDSFSGDWHKDGELHKDEGSPATVICDASGKIRLESYMVNGIGHRGNGMPSETNPGVKTWMVEGVLHNSFGPAEEYEDLTKGPNLYTWSLYGAEITETVFLDIKELSNKTGSPLWAAFMFRLKIITLEHLAVFMNTEGEWESTAPVSWVLRAWNINAEKFSEKMDKSEDIEFAYYDGDSEERFRIFMKVIKSDEKDALTRATQNKEESDD